MKKLLLSTIIATFSLFTYAQNDPAVKKIMNEVAAKYDSYKNIEATFDFHLANERGQIEHTSQGMLYLHKPKNQYNILLNEGEIISNGKTIWNISEEDKEINISDIDNNSNIIGPNNLFTFYQKGYNYKLLNRNNTNTGANKEIELIPIDTKTNYSKIILNVSKNNTINSVTLFDKSRRRYIYTIKKLSSKNELPASLFTLNKEKYKNYYINDLR